MRAAGLEVKPTKKALLAAQRKLAQEDQLKLKQQQQLAQQEQQSQLLLTTSSAPTTVVPNSSFLSPVTIDIKPYPATASLLPQDTARVPSTGSVSLIATLQPAPTFAISATTLLTYPPIILTENGADVQFLPRHPQPVALCTYNVRSMPSGAASTTRSSYSRLSSRRSDNSFAAIKRVLCPKNVNTVKSSSNTTTYRCTSNSSSSQPALTSPPTRTSSSLSVSRSPLHPAVKRVAVDSSGGSGSVSVSPSSTSSSSVTASPFPTSLSACLDSRVAPQSDPYNFPDAITTYTSSPSYTTIRPKITVSTTNSSPAISVLSAGGAYSNSNSSNSGGSNSNKRKKAAKMSSVSDSVSSSTSLIANLLNNGQIKSLGSFNRKTDW